MALPAPRRLLLCVLLISFCISEIAFGLTDVSRLSSSSMSFRTEISTRGKEGQSYQIRSILHPIGTQAARRLTAEAGKPQEDVPPVDKGQLEEPLSEKNEDAAGKGNSTPPTSSPKQSDHDKPEGDTPDKPDSSAKNDTGKDSKQTPSSKHNNECESHCQDANKVLSACLRPDGTHMLSLSITNEGDDNVTVKVLAPTFLTAKPPELLVRKGTTEMVEFVMDSKTTAELLDAEGAKSMNITITSDHGMCEIGVPIEYLRSSTQQGHLSYSSLFSPRAGIYALLFVLVLAAGIWMYCRYQERKRSSDGVKYQELEMNVAGVGSPNERVSKSGGQSTDGWDEVWDDDWEDTEAARSSSRMSQSLSSKGLAARRGNKDGLDNSWDD